MIKKDGARMKKAFLFLCSLVIGFFVFAQVPTIPSISKTVKQNGFYIAGPVGNISFGDNPKILGRLNYKDAVNGKISSSVLVFISMRITQIDTSDKDDSVYYWGEVTTVPPNAESGSYPKEFYIIYSPEPIKGYKRGARVQFYATYIQTGETTSVDASTGIKTKRSVPIFRVVYAGFTN
jgi:hypothetical protein